MEGQTTINIVAILVLIIVSNADAQDSTQVVGIAGESVQMNCTIAHDVDNVDVKWKDRVYNEVREPKVIYENGHVSQSHPRSSVYQLTEKKDLIISRLSYEDAGDYFCQVGDNDVKYYLSVVDKPKCKGPQVLTPGQEAEIACEMRYTGWLYMPNLKWLTNNDTLNSFEKTDLQSAKIVAKVSGTADKHNQMYTCVATIGNLKEHCSIQLNIDTGPATKSTAGIWVILLSFMAYIMCWD